MGWSQSLGRKLIHYPDSEILDRLSEIAPVTVVRGNVDREAWARNIPETNVLEVDGVSIYVLHILESLDLKPEAAGIRVVVYGQTACCISILAAPDRAGSSCLSQSVN